MLFMGDKSELHLWDKLPCGLRVDVSEVSTHSVTAAMNFLLTEPEISQIVKSKKVRIFSLYYRH
jgi:hypothetical protein